MLEKFHMTLKEVRESALALSKSSRAKLVHDLILSIDEVPPGGLSEDDPEFKHILNTRLADYQSGKTKAIPWETVREKLKQQTHENRPAARSRTRAY